MKIFGIGLTRTGTSSLAYALNQVGFNIIDYPNNKQLFDLTNDGACDIPAASHYKILDKKFTNSKFIYTVRKKDDWLMSIENYLKDRPSPSAWGELNRLMLYGQLEFNKDIFLERYDFHDRDVRAYFNGREQDLLILDICNGDKLEKLLTFIGLPSNDTDSFPHIHKGESR